MLKHLEDNGVREAMLKEVAEDIRSGRLYQSRYFTAAGKDAWPKLLTEAVGSKGPDWLVEQLRNSRFWLQSYEKATPSGGRTQAKVPVTAPETMANGEFSRFYFRGLSVIAMQSGQLLRVVRVAEVARPRKGSEEKLGMTVSPTELLDDLRVNLVIDTFLGVPAGPNSGLGVELE